MMWGNKVGFDYLDYQQGPWSWRTREIPEKGEKVKQWLSNLSEEKARKRVKANCRSKTNLKVRMKKNKNY